MIKGTNADCKVLSIDINQTVATVKLLIFATQSTVPAKSFRIALKDLDNETIYYVDNNTYWIDYINVYNNETTNIDTKKYKEILFNIDITNQNNGKLQGTRWIRNCYIMLLDQSKISSEQLAWRSEDINLISDSFVVPEIKNFVVDTMKTKELKISFTLKYESEKDFDLNNKNLSVQINIRSISSDKIIESLQIENYIAKEYNYFITRDRYDVGFPVAVQLLITNKIGEVLLEYRKAYCPLEKYSNAFVKTEKGVKRVIAYYVNLEAEGEHEGDWL